MYVYLVGGVELEKVLGFPLEDEVLELLGCLFYELEASDVDFATDVETHFPTRHPLKHIAFIKTRSNSDIVENRCAIMNNNLRETTDQIGNDVIILLGQHLFLFGLKQKERVMRNFLRPAQ